VSFRGRAADTERRPPAPAVQREPPPPAVADVQREAPPPPSPPVAEPAPAPAPAPVEPAAAAAAESGGPSDEERMEQARASVRKAEELLGEDRAQDAIAELGPALVLLLGEESIRARVALARAYMTMPKLRGRAEGVLTEAIRDSPKDPALHVLLGRLHAQRGHRDAAIASFRKALELAPGHGEAQGELDAVLATPEEPSKAGRTKR